MKLYPTLSILVIGVFMTAILCVAGCDAKINASIGQEKPTDRFNGGGQSCYLVIDRQTGKEYLAVHGCGLIEVEPTKP